MKTFTKKSLKIVYASAAMGINLLNTMVGSYLCSALLIGGFSESVVPFQTYAQKDLIIPAVWAGFVLIAKIIDGIIDIPMASFTDNLKSKYGRRRPAIAIGLIGVVVAYLLLLVIPDNSGATIGNTIYYGVVLCIFYSFYTLTMVTYYATYTEIVDTEEDRAFMSDTKSVCDIVYFIIGYVGVRALLNSLNIRIVALIVLPLALLMLIPIFIIKEESTLNSKNHSKRIKMLTSIKFTFENKPFVRWMIVYSFMTFGVQLFLAGINEYFSFVGINMIFVMLASFIPVPAMLVLYNLIKKKYGFFVAFRYALAMFSLGMIISYFTGILEAGTLKTVLSVICGLSCSFAIGSLFSVAYALPSELAAEEELRTGNKNSAMYFAVQGLFSGVASGIATGIVLTALKGSENDCSVAIKYMTLISAAGTIAAFILMGTLPETIKNIGKK